MKKFKHHSLILYSNWYFHYWLALFYTEEIVIEEVYVEASLQNSAENLRPTVEIVYKISIHPLLISIFLLTSWECRRSGRALALLRSGKLCSRWVWFCWASLFEGWMLSIRARDCSSTRTPTKTTHCLWPGSIPELQATEPWSEGNHHLRHRKSTREVR